MTKPNRAQRRDFVRQAKTYTLRFEDPELEGLEVRARSVDVGTFMSLIDLADHAGLNEGVASNDVEAVKALLGAFADAVVSWNLAAPVLDAAGEPTGETEPVPHTAGGLNTQDLDFVFSLIGAWMDAIAGVSGPLSPTSSGGKPSAVPPLPMDELSASPAS